MIKLIHGDCLEKMKDIEDGSIDLTVTSPPYDNLRTYNNTLEWDFGVFQHIAEELFRVTKKGGVVVWVVGDATIKGSETGTSFKQALFFKEIGFNLHDTMIYQKTGISFPETNRYYPNFEYMLVLSKGKPTTVNLIKDRKNKYSGHSIHGPQREKDGTVKPKSAVKNKTGRLVKAVGVRMNVWQIPSMGVPGTKHPATFPEQLAHDHIISWSNPGDLVFDPLMGSGTVGNECKKLSRSFIGIEKVKEYFDIATKRINDQNKSK